jgi:Tfp pilus assembly protein PilF
MLNHALRLMDVDIIIKMGFFINDLHHHIEQLHSNQFNGHQSDNSFTVYRGQGMSKTDFDQMTKTKGGLMSFNSFLSTSKDRAVPFAFATSNSNNPDLLGILFAMTIHPTKSTTPFASIIDVSHFKDEDEVFFAMHIVFPINGIKPMAENHRLFQVELTLTSDNDKDLRVLTNRIREETFPDLEGWYRLGVVLLKLGQPNKTETVYKILLEQTSEEREKGLIYNELGCVNADLGKHKEAIIFLEKSLEVYNKTLTPNHRNLASSYNNIGMVYDDMGEYSKALSYYEKAYEIDQKSLSPNHPDLATSNNNIGLVYLNMGEYSKAFSFFERAVNIGQQSLASNHPHLQIYRNNFDRIKKIM